MIKYVYPLKCNACDDLERFDFKLPNGVEEDYWAKLRLNLDKKEHLCGNCLILSGVIKCKETNSK